MALPIGIIPGGSGNGLAVSLQHAASYPIVDDLNNVLAAAFGIARGWSRPLDLAVVDTGHARRASFLSLSWGFISDCDIESERWRCLGGARFSLQAAIRAVNLRRYDGRLSFLPADAVLQESPGPTIGMSEAPSFCDVPLGYCPPLDEPVPENWVTVEGSMIFVWASTVSHGASDLHIAPGKAPGDGFIQLTYVRNIGRCSLAPILLGFESGKHVRHAACHNVNVKAFRLEPGAGCLSLDGELIPLGPIQYEMRRGVLRVLALEPRA